VNAQVPQENEMTQGDDRRADRETRGLRLSDRRPDDTEGLERSRLALVSRVIESQRALATMQATLVEMLASLLDGPADGLGPALRVVPDSPADAG
jgi:hypothetical protein